jgi:hypothetical protein
LYKLLEDKTSLTDRLGQLVFSVVGFKLCKVLFRQLPRIENIYQMHFNGSNNSTAAILLESHLDCQRHFAIALV